jgi:hypothetical protein
MMKNIGPLLLIFLSALMIAGQTQSYVGYRYKPVLAERTLPNGVKSLGGGIVGDVNKKPLWGIAEMNKGRTRMLWLERAVSEDAHGVNEWEVMDVVSVRNFPAGIEFIFGTGNCKENGKDNDALVVQAAFNARRLTYKTIKAWHADIVSARFVPIDAADVKCEYDAP